MSDGFWIGLQMDHDAAEARDSLAETLGKITPWRGTKPRASTQSPLPIASRR